MLRTLHVRNLAVLKEAAVEFGPGLNVVTGETGAGKSLVVDSLALLAGARASAELIRTGDEVCSVTGVFEPGASGWREVLEAAGVDASGEELVVRRELSRSGKNRVFLNDQPVTLKLLVELAPFLLGIHGQREELGLVSPDLQRSWLDSIGGAKGRELLARCEEAHRSYGELAFRLERLTGDDRLRQERIDLLRFQTAEIEAARLSAGEEIELRRQRDQLRHGEAIARSLDAGVALLSEDEGSASERLARSRAALQEIVPWQGEAEGWLAELDELQIRVDEVAAGLRRGLLAVEDDPGQLDRVEDRLATLERLFRKYGKSSDEVLEHRARLLSELGELEGDESQRETLSAEVEAALERYREAASRLSQARSRWGKRLMDDLRVELTDLALDRARFEVELERRNNAQSALRLGGEGVEFGPRGYDRVVFRLQTNPGEELRPLARVASGGELSRVYLALQVAVRGAGGAAPEATLVFDEVDAGVGGTEAATVGRKLKRLASGAQLLAVTHLPQVASYGDVHFRVQKQVRSGRTHVSVEALGGRERIEEVARMLAGEEITSLSRSHAEELLAGAITE